MGHLHILNIHVHEPRSKAMNLQSMETLLKLY